MFLQEWPALTWVRPPREHKLPVILSREEVQRILSCLRRPYYRLCLSTIYSCGLRLHEGVHLQVSDIDSARMLIHVHQGKGSKDRYVPLPECHHLPRHKVAGLDPLAHLAQVLVITGASFRAQTTLSPLLPAPTLDIISGDKYSYLRGTGPHSGDNPVKRDSHLTKNSGDNTFMSQDHLARVGKSTHTVKAYNRDVGAFALWWEQSSGQEFNPQVVDPRDIQEYRGYLVCQERAPATINRRLIALCRFFHSSWRAQPWIGANCLK